MPFTPAYITPPKKEKGQYSFSVSRIVIISLLLFLLMAMCLYLHHTAFSALKSDFSASEKINSSWIVGELGYFLPMLTVCLFLFAVYAKHDRQNGIIQKEMAWEILISTALVYIILLPLTLYVSDYRLTLQLASGAVVEKTEGKEYATLFLSLAEWFIRLPVPMLLLYLFHTSKAQSELSQPENKDAEDNPSQKQPAEGQDGGSHEKKSMIVSSIPKLRDPFIVVDEKGVYYAHGTGWHCYKNDSGSLSGAWEDLGQVVQNLPDDDGTQHWAPEVHKYNDAYYMITTYCSSENQHRGCVVLRSESPAGPFTPVSEGHVTPRDWDCIDGTLHVDKEGQPWMVFVHEWTCQPDHVGTFAAAKLSDDLSHLVSEPIELFRADAPSWAKAGVTDGCFMYTTETGDLLMLWSNFAADGYCVAIARSDNGKLDGNWSHDDTLLFSKEISGEYDGGHGMLFTDADGQTYLSIHSPQTLEGADRLESPVFVPVREENNTLVWDR